ncbi:erythromycin esterase family protein [Nocardia inohanensis]|uniref:erythromycin esterase family protein n=1 Tax=Nocardia inohanensis TaxID=209246 RepID=UPI00082E91EF|nr:erythromycin esterase family protein [Nocardia inohanensis]
MTATLGDLDVHPFDRTAVVALARSVAGASVVGIGESTRFSRETFEARDRLFRELVGMHGFRALAVQDSADTAARLDDYVRTGAGTAAEALENAWRPLRTAEMAAALDWIRDFNRARPGDRVRIIGVKPAQAQPADYDSVLAAVTAHAPELAERVRAPLAVIRTAHTVDEHVQQAQGSHPGGSFAARAREVEALLRSAAGLPETVLERLRLIVDFHERSVAGQGNFLADETAWARTMLADHRRNGSPIVYWDGLAHTSATPTGYGAALPADTAPSAGSVLRRELGQGYASIAVTFHHGDLGIHRVPAPQTGLVDADLGEFPLPALWLDLRQRSRPTPEPARLRVISGIYDPAHDAAAQLTVPSLPAAFDAVIHFQEVSPVHWLP